MGFGDFIEDIRESNADAAARFAARKAAAEYRAKARKYRELVAYLEEKISLIDSKLDDVAENLSSQHEKFILNPESAEGLLIIMFDKKEGNVWKTQYETILSNMRQGLVNLRMKKSSAEQLAVYWEQRAEIEEAKAYAGI